MKNAGVRFEHQHMIRVDPYAIAVRKRATRAVFLVRPRTRTVRRGHRFSFHEAQRFHVTHRRGRPVDRADVRNRVSAHYDDFVRFLARESRRRH